MRVCANMHDINTNNNTYAYIRQLDVYLRQYSINYKYFQTKNGKIRKFTTICGEITVNSWLCRINFDP